MRRGMKHFWAFNEDEQFHGRHHHAGRGRHGGGGGGRIFKSGDLRFLLLALVGEQPRYGYELIKAIEQQFAGTYSPSPGSVYPTLTLLEDLGYVLATTPEGAKKRYGITESGQAYLKENQVLVTAAQTRMGMLVRARSGQAVPEVIREAMATLKMAISLNGRGWSEVETARVSGIIHQAAMQIEQADQAL